MAGKTLTRRRVFVTVAVVAAAVSDVSGQTRTADGVVALARGDYQRAVEVLRPTAEDWRSRDSVAQFFMAGLYEAGRGVPVDPLRACALYLRAGSDFDSPFGRQAQRLLGPYMARGKEFSDECQLLAILGFDHGFEPVTFHLGPGHFVEWTLTAATVTDGERTNRVETPAGPPGSRFLPLAYTELSTGPTRSQKRHFVEMFVWHPSGQERSASWTLQWRLFEVVADQIVTIEILEPLATAEGEVPPSPKSFDVREHAVVRVDDEGNAEWAVLKGPVATAQQIESDAERREARAIEVARDAALKRVDWSRRYDPTRQPTMAYSDADGCGHVQVYGWSADRAEAVVVRADASALNLSTQPATFELSRESVNIAVTAYVYSGGQQQFYFCSDVRMPAASDSTGPETWNAIAGTITIALSPEGIVARNARLRRATITLNNLVLRNAAGITVRVNGPVRLTAVVGAFFG